MLRVCTRSRVRCVCGAGWGRRASKIDVVCRTAGLKLRRQNLSLLKGAAAAPLRSPLRSPWRPPLCSRARDPVVRLPLGLGCHESRVLPQLGCFLIEFAFEDTDAKGAEGRAGRAFRPCLSVGQTAARESGHAARLRGRPSAWGGLGAQRRVCPERVPLCQVCALSWVTGRVPVLGDGLLRPPLQLPRLPLTLALRPHECSRGLEPRTPQGPATVCPL